LGETATRKDTRAITLRRFALAAVVILLTALSIAVFPGHSLLASDTQIYLPILEHLRDHSVLAHDAVAQRPHVSFTIYDEVALALRRAGIDFETGLVLQQFLFRALGILGVWLIASSLGLGFAMSTVTAAVFSLGAVIGGPTVLTVEYEPVPRGFAVPLLVLAMGCAAHGRDLLAGAAASAAFLYHPPSAVTFWGVYFGLSLWPSNPKLMSRRVLGLAPLLAGVLVMLVFSRAQGGVSEVQPFFGESIRNSSGSSACAPRTIGSRPGPPHGRPSTCLSGARRWLRTGAFAVMQSRTSASSWSVCPRSAS
jgi:hypothetical protein